ncbi:hypothetical protein D9M73_235350 [compost metagenome]
MHRSNLRPALFDTRRLQHPAGGGRGVKDAVAVDQQTTFQPLAQRRFALAQGVPGDQFAGHALGLQHVEFVFGHGHLFGIGRQPQGAVAAVGAVCGEPGGQFTPALQRMLAERQLCGIVVEHQQVAHASGRGAVQTGIEH